MFYIQCCLNTGTPAKAIFLLNVFQQFLIELWALPRSPCQLLPRPPEIYVELMVSTKIEFSGALQLNSHQKLCNTCQQRLVLSTQHP